MHILILVLSVLGGAAFWWYRLKYIRDAGSEVADAVGRARGQMRRSKLRKQAQESPVTAVDSPVIAAATLLTTLITTSPMLPKQEDAVRVELSAITSGEQMDEAIVYGRWVETQGLDRRKSVTLLCEKLVGWLSVDERSDVADMISALDADKSIQLHQPMVEIAMRKLRPRA